MKELITNFSSEEIKIIKIFDKIRENEHMAKEFSKIHDPYDKYNYFSDIYFHEFKTPLSYNDYTNFTSKYNSTNFESPALDSISGGAMSNVILNALGLSVLAVIAVTAYAQKEEIKKYFY
ncbi:MAG: hypothetical protein NkDv07_0401 [Candidatus Improbicoccus devescovinae]|nr:MAG: hypothetical protein NkDv07_0401 [Candidatus Improbicoccus devescovinae]